MFYSEIIKGSYTVVRNNIKGRKEINIQRDPTCSLPRSSTEVMYCKTVVQYRNQNTDIDTVKMQNRSIMPTMPHVALE